MSTQQDWILFLQSQNARFENGRVVDFGSTSNIQQTDARTNFISDLSDLGLIQVNGSDARDFLQNQFCNDLREVDDQHSQINAYCNPKGRVLAVMRILRKNDAYLLLLPNELIETIVKRLKMFVLMSDVIISDISDSLIGVGILGVEIQNYFTRSYFALPDIADGCLSEGEIITVKLPGIVPRFVVLAPLPTMKNIWQKMASEYKPMPTDAWTFADIQSGIPQVFSATSAAFVPQMLNLHAIKGLSFSKGCYPGQEVVARMHYLGTLKRRMYLCHVEGQNCPLPGATLFAENNTDDQGVGKIVHAAANPQGGCDFLAVMQIKAVESDQIYLDNTKKDKVIFKDLPYSVEVSRQSS